MCCFAQARVEQTATLDSSAGSTVQSTEFRRLVARRGDSARSLAGAFIRPSVAFVLRQLRCGVEVERPQVLTSSDAVVEKRRRCPTRSTGDSMLYEFVTTY